MVREAFLIYGAWAGAALLLVLPFSSAAEEGPELFKKLECNKCHAVAAEGIERIETEKKEEKSAFSFLVEEEKEEDEGPDLSDIGKERDAEWLKKWLLKDVKNDDGKKHKKKFKGTDDELDKIVGYLTTLKTKPPEGTGE